jgi:branched-chain amino acid transport system substrate-binding protein
MEEWEAGANMKLVAVLLLFLLTVACTQQTTEPIKIGFSAPLSGSLGTWGEPDMQGVALAVKEINAAGGINGRPLEVIYEDDQCDAKVAASAMNKFATVDKVTAVVGTICSGTTLAAAPIAEQNGIVLVSIGSSHPKITTAGDYIFRVWPSDSFQGEILAKHLWDEGYKNIAILSINSDYAQGVEQVFTSEYEKLGGKVVIAEHYAVGTTDMRTELSKIRAAKPDAILVLQHEEAPTIHRQMRELSINQQVFGTETYDSAPLREAAKGAMTGAIYSMPAFDEENVKIKEFKENYRKEYGKDPIQTIVAAYGYDTMNIIAGCLKKDATSQGLKDCLYTIQNYEGVGGTISFDQNGDILRSFAFKRIEGADTVTIKD